MKPSRLKSLTTQALLDTYKAASARHGQAIEAGDSKGANREFDLLTALHEELRHRGLEARRLLLPLLHDSEPGTRYWAATDSLELAPAEAQRVLAALAATPNSLVGFSARMALVQSKQGDPSS